MTEVMDIETILPRLVALSERRQEAYHCSYYEIIFYVELGFDVSPSLL
jgi:hypothetical protein